MLTHHTLARMRLAAALLAVATGLASLDARAPRRGRSAATRAFVRSMRGEGVLVIGVESRARDHATSASLAGVLNASKWPPPSRRRRAARASCFEAARGDAAATRIIAAVTPRRHRDAAANRRRGAAATSRDRDSLPR